MKILFLIAVLLPIITYGNFIKQFISGLKGKSIGSPSALKTEILNLAEKVNRGLTETTKEREVMLKLFEKLEKKNKYKNSLNSPLINAIWDLKYTTSDSILGRGGSPRVGPILQVLFMVYMDIYMCVNMYVCIYMQAPSGTLVLTDQILIATIYIYIITITDHRRTESICKEQ